MPVKTGTITLAWGDDEYPFRLAIGELQELERKTDAGPLELYDRLIARKWHVADLREIHRNGLIGGGMAPPDAMKLVRRYVDERPLMESVSTAQAILLSALLGPPDDSKKAEAEDGPKTSPSPSADSIESGLASDSDQATLTT